MAISHWGEEALTEIRKHPGLAVVMLLISCFLTLIGMLLSDLSYAIVDPRISFD